MSMEELSPTEKSILKFLENREEQPEKDVLRNIPPSAGIKRIFATGPARWALRALDAKGYVQRWWRDDQPKRRGMRRCLLTPSGQTALERSAS